MIIQINNQAVPSETERNRLFDTYITPNLTLIRQIVGHFTLAHYDIDDNMQEILLHLLHAVSFYDPAVANIATWLRRVVTNKMHDLNRRFHHAADRWADSPLLHPDDPDDEDTCTALPASLTTPAIETFPMAKQTEVEVETFPMAPQAEVETETFPAASSQEGVPSVPILTLNPDDYPICYDALQRLPMKQRRVLLLTAEGWEAEEIAKEMRITLSNVYTLLSRARSRMLEFITKRRKEALCN